MHYIVEDIGYETARNAFADHGFGINEVKDQMGQVAVADIWTDNNINGTGEIGGFRVGTITRSLQSFGSICRLEVTEHQLGSATGRERLTKAFSQILNHSGIR